MKSSVHIIFCTTASLEEAKLISKTLVEKQLAACCTIVPQVTSIYAWRGKIEEESEYLLIIKTSSKNYEQVEKEIKMLHSYTVPEIIGLHADKGSQAYIDWLMESVNN